MTRVIVNGVIALGLAFVLGLWLHLFGVWGGMAATVLALVLTFLEPEGGFLTGLRVVAGVLALWIVAHLLFAKMLFPPAGLVADFVWGIAIACVVVCVTDLFGDTRPAPASR